MSGSVSPTAFRGVDERVQRDVAALVDAKIVGVFYDTLQLGAVYVIERGRLPQALIWPTVYSYSRLNALNSVVLNSCRYCDAITWEQFLQEPNGQALEWLVAAVPTIIEGTEETWRLFNLNDLDIAIRRNLWNNLIAPP